MQQQKPDFTAWFVLQGVIAAMHQAEFRDAANENTLELYKILSQEAANTRTLSQLISKLPYSWQYKVGELVTNSGRLRHFYLRKKEIEAQTRKLLEAEGVKQVIMLGAGLDVLALRLSEEYKDVKFIEIDREESQNFKSASLAKHGVEIPKNLELVSGDLRNPLASILEQSKFYNKSGKTLWICEGLFMFIPEESVERIFREIKDSCAENSYCIFTSWGGNANQSGFAKLIQKLYLKKEKCSYFWQIYPQEVADFLQKLNISMVAQISSDMLHKNHSAHKNKINHNIGDDINIAKIYSSSP